MPVIIFMVLLIFSAVPSSAMPDNYVPQYAVEYAEQYKAEFMKEYSNAAQDLSYRFFYNNDGEACLEFTVTPKGRFVWPQTKWIGFTWSNKYGSIGISAINYTLTKKLADEAEYRMEERRKDKAFAEIEKVVLQVATDYDYDFQSVGIAVKYRRSNVKKAYCEGYSGAIENAFRNHPLVSKVETWVSAAGNHAWNVIILKDGRKIYCDSTWYDGNKIDDEGYVINIPDRDPVNLTFDINEFNNLGGAVNRATGRLIQVHFAWSDAKLR